MTLREYEVATGDPWGRTTTIQLSDEDAKARGLIPHTKADTKADAEDDAGDGDKADTKADAEDDAGDGDKADTKADAEDDAGDGDKADGGDAGGQKQAKAPANKAAPKAPAHKGSAEA
ncbi:hypothetical protein P5V90_14700 [Mycobacteroides abscessus subsp. abscessus]|uniref:hypothetical protein n=1 Tax=Mycobacteroides abscessus TaxID=36809 RepID=UPI00266BE71A|nr:hypothetical protein [Mycobacteroides abscessus]MDO3168215.1 hypothetical protein [Mycobacteroides abscessus subsp. abscessus]